MNTNLNTDIYDADVYLRLSKEDGDKEESDSITNQKELILEYLKSKPEIKIHEIRVDDGYSGVNFDRPAFQQMLEDIKSGTVNCVITKDLSRFGRNHIEVGKYLEKIFPYLGVRFIAVNDNYDSVQNGTQGSNIIVPFKNLINDAYCRDISIKIRSNLEVKRKRGDYVGAFAPYGYQKSNSNKNKLEIDEEAAEVVRSIFRMYMKGNSAYKIADMLNQKDVATPMDYKRDKGSSFYTSFKKNMRSEWTHVTVLRILNNPVYVGTTVQGRGTTPNYKVKKKIRRDESKWNIVEHTHEPIISDIDYRNVQELLKMDTRTADSEDNIYCLSGIVRCGDCEANMVKKTVPYEEKKYIYYVCGGHKQNKRICSNHSIKAEVLEESVLKLLNHQIKVISDMEVVLNRLEEKECKSSGIEKKKQQIASKKEEIQKINALRLDLYEDFKESLLTKEEYLELKQIYGQRIQAAESAMDVLGQEVELLISNQGHLNEWMEEFKKFGHMESLSREAVVSLIDKILVYEKQKGERHPRIEVKFKYAEEISEALELMSDSQAENKETL